MADFEIAVHRTMGLEGGFSHHPADTGGRTMHGISEKWFPEAWEDGIPTIEDACSIYRNHFWVPLRCDLIDSQNIANELFDTGVNLGIGKAASILQESINALTLQDSIAVDGRMGPLTIGAANQLAGNYERALFNYMNYLQAHRYADPMLPGGPKKQVFLRGWFAHRIGGWVDYE